MSFLSRIFRRTPVASSGRLMVDAIMAQIYQAQPMSAAHYNESRSAVECVLVYDAVDHWHFVTVGLTRIDSPRKPLECELSMRVRKREGHDSPPPLWPVAFLDNLAGHVSRGLPFGQATSFRTGPVEGSPPELAMEGAIALSDPGVPRYDGPLGRLMIMLAVGLTGPTLSAIKSNGGAEFIARISEDRSSWLT